MWRSRLGSALAALLVLVTATTIDASRVSAATGVVVTTYANATIRRPNGITLGPDGAFWFVNLQNNSVGRITTSGNVTNYTDASINLPEGITVGPDGALWFTNVGGGSGTGSIGRITTSGTISNYADSSVDSPREIVAGPDGALWFTNSGAPGGTGSIGRITTTGTITHYTAAATFQPFAITTGPDGALWFTTVEIGLPTDPQFIEHAVGRIAIDGTISFYTDPRIGTFDSDGLTTGPDGALWFTDTGPHAIDRITTAGAFSQYPDASSTPIDIAVAADGALWFTDNATNNIGRITTTGAITNYAGPALLTTRDLVAGPDDALWFTSYFSSVIGRIELPPPAVVPYGGVVTEGASGTTSQLSITVTLSRASTRTVTAQWNTVFINGASDVQAVPGTDYLAASGTVTFPPGATTETVPVTVVNHDLGMPYKLLVVSFHNPINGTMGGYWGLAFGFIVGNST